MAVCLRSQLTNGQVSSTVEFNNPDVAPPNPEFLRIHAAFAKVLHACGAAEYFQKLQRDAEEVKELYLDGQADFGQALASQLSWRKFQSVY